jgi:hypothetical protein
MALCRISAKATEKLAQKQPAAANWHHRKWRKTISAMKAQWRHRTWRKQKAAAEISWRKHPAAANKRVAAASMARRGAAAARASYGLEEIENLAPLEIEKIWRQSSSIRRQS